MSETEEMSMEAPESNWTVENGATQQDAVTKKLKTIGFGVVAIIVIALGVYFYNGMKETTNEEAMTALARISTYYEAGDFKKALDGDPARNIRGGKVVGLRVIADQYSGTTAGSMAALYAGTSLVNVNSFSEAVSFFEQAASSGDAIISAGGKAGLALCKEQNKQFEEAAALYEEAAGDKDSPMNDRYSFFAALNYEKAAQSGSSTAKEKAITLLQTILLKNNGSEFVNEAKMGLSRLGWHEN